MSARHLGLGLCALAACAAPPAREEAASAPDAEAGEVLTVAKRAERPPGPTRAERRRELARQVGSLPGWRLRETAHYFVLTDVSDEAFLRELETRLEAMRRSYDELVPHPLADPVPVRTAPISVRVMKSASAYHEYGGPGGSAGYWTPMHEELVLYDDAAGDGRRDTWYTLQSLGFRAWLDETHPELGFDPWFEHGQAGWFGGFELADGELVPSKRAARDVDVVRGALVAGRTAPLNELVRMDRAAFYGDDPRRVSQATLAAQAATLVSFLREQAAALDPRWPGIPQRYVDALLAGRDRDAARAAAFEGVELNTLEAAWRAWVAR